MITKGDTKLIRKRKARASRKSQLKTKKRIDKVVEFLRTPINRQEEQNEIPGE